MPYLLASVLDHLPSPLAWIVSDFTDFDELAVIALMANGTTPFMVGLSRPNFSVAIDVWPTLAVTTRYAHFDDQARHETFDRVMGIRSSNPMFWILLIGMVDIVLRNSPAIVEACGMCRKKS